MQISVENDEERDKTPMKTLGKTISAVLATWLIGSALFSQQAQADPMINGSITFEGSVDLDSNSPVTATRVVGWHGVGGVGNPIVTAATGDFDVTPGVTTGVFYVPWDFNSGPITAFWTTGGFVFDLVVSTITAQGPTDVFVTGYGWIKHAGYADTYGTWMFQTTTFGLPFGPSAGTPARFSFSVPESGSTLAFLGLALVSVEALRRRMRTAG